MTLVVDASAVMAALVGSDADGRWAESVLRQDTLAAPHLMPVEAANILRRSGLAGSLSADAAALAHNDLVQLRVELFPYAPLAGRVWQLRENLTAYDAWYVALAEALRAPLVTIDRRLSRAPGPQCEFRVPPTDATMAVGPA